MASDAGRFGASTAKAASGDELMLRAIAAENLSHLEQRYVGKAAVRILLCSSNKPRDQARSHIRKIRSDWIGEREFGLSAAEQLRLLLRNKRPGHGLEHAARGEPGLGFAGAQQNGRKPGLGGSLTSNKGRGRNAIPPDNPHDLPP